MFARCLTLAALLLCAAQAAAAPPQIWLGPLDNLHRPPLPNGPADYPDLFAPDATWPAQLPQVKVFKIYQIFVGQSTDAQLKQVIDFLKAHHIKLALEEGVLSPTPACGTQVEGFYGVNLAAVANRIRLLGGTVDALAMDEPLYYGNYYSGPRACRATLRALAENAAVNIRALRAVMPNIQIGDIEVANGLLTPAVWAGEIGQWAQAFQAATGVKFAFLQLDVIWSQPVLGYVRAETKAMHAQGIPVGVIFNGSGAEQTDQAWAQAVHAHCAMLRKAGDVPDQAVFQTWVAEPSHELPVSDPTSMTGLVHAYVSSLTRAGG